MFGLSGISKLCNVLFTNELQRRLNEQGLPIICLSVHPGGVHEGVCSLFVVALVLYDLTI